MHLTNSFSIVSTILVIPTSFIHGNYGSSSNLGDNGGSLLSLPVHSTSQFLPIPSRAYFPLDL